MTKGKELELSEDSKTEKSFLHRANPLRQLHYCVFNGEVANMLELLLKRYYTFLIVDIPYGFHTRGSTHDDVPFMYPQIEKMVKDFTELTLAPLWRIIIFHTMGQSLSVTTTLKSRCHATKHLHWCVTCCFFTICYSKSCSYMLQIPFLLILFDVNRIKTNITCIPVEHLCMGYYDSITKKKAQTQ